MAETLVGRNPVSPCDFFLRNPEISVAHFTQLVSGTTTAYAACVTAEVDVEDSGTKGSHATALRGVVSGASGATMANVIPLSLETYITDAPTALHAMMRFNTNAAADTPDVWFTSNKQAVAYEIGTGTSATRAGGIKVKITGANLLNSANGYIHVYQDNT